MQYFDSKGWPYRYCWVGYHIHGKAVSKVDPQYCPLDVYYQDSAMRYKNPEVYDHWLVTDQVAPCMVHLSEERIYIDQRVFKEEDW